MTRSKKEAALARLEKARGPIAQLMALNRKAPEYLRWRRDTELALRNTFTGSERHLKEFRRSLVVWQGVSPLDEPEISRRSRDKNAYVEELKKADALLESMIDEVSEYWEESNGAERAVGSRDVVAERSGHRVFVVHGRDRGARETVARFLENLGLEPVILSETPAMGRTIIEKFEEHSQVGFAIVLLTPDDVGSLRGYDREARPRARQNVIFELGFFVGRLGRGGVCALTRGDVEIPSDYAGVEYIHFDESDGWKEKLRRELETAGLPVDGRVSGRA